MIQHQMLEGRDLSYMNRIKKKKKKTVIFKERILTDRRCWFWGEGRGGGYKQKKDIQSGEEFVRDYYHLCCIAFDFSLSFSSFSAFMNH